MPDSSPIYSSSNINMSQIPGHCGTMPGNGAYSQSETNQSGGTTPMFGGTNGIAEQQPSANNNGTFEEDLKRRPPSYSRHRPSGRRHARYSSASRSRSRSRGCRHGRRRDARSRSPERGSSHRRPHRGPSRSPMMQHQSRNLGIREAKLTALKEEIAEHEQMSKKMAGAVAAYKQLLADASVEAELEALILLYFACRDHSNAVSKESILRGGNKAILLATQDQFKDLGHGINFILNHQRIEKERNKARFAGLENKITALGNDVATLVRLFSTNGNTGSAQA